MGKKKRSGRITVSGSIEGKQEHIILEHLKSLYFDPETMSFPDNPNRNGGTPNSILDHALKNQHYDRSFAWIDEDSDLNEVSRTNLAKHWCVEENALLTCPLRQIQTQFNANIKKLKKPVLIVSYPVCVEGFILRILGIRTMYSELEESNRKSQIKYFKDSLAGIIGGKKEADYAKYYANVLTKSYLEERRKEIYELDLLLFIISKPG